MPVRQEPRRRTRSRTSSTRYRAANPLQYVVIVGDDDIDPVLPLPRRDAARQRNRLRAAGPRHERLAGQPAARLRPEPGRLRLGQRHLDQGQRLSRARPRRRAARRDAAEISGLLDAYLAPRAASCRRRAPRSSPATTSWPTRANAVDDRARRRAPARTAGHADHSRANVSPLDPALLDRGRSCGRSCSAQRHDLIFLAGHFSANSALAADFATSMLTTELAASSVDLTQHDRLQRRLPLRLQHRRRRRASRRDRAARLGAGVRAEARDADRRHRLPVRRHRLPRVQRAALPRTSRTQLRAGTGAVAVGEALVAGQAGLPRGARPTCAGIAPESAARGDALRPADARASTCRPAAAARAAAAAPIVGGDDAGSRTRRAAPRAARADMTFSPPLVQQTHQPDERRQPGLVGDRDAGSPARAGSRQARSHRHCRWTRDVTRRPERVLRGIGFRERHLRGHDGHAADRAPTTEIRGVHSPFSSSSFYPGAPWTHQLLRRPDRRRRDPPDADPRAVPVDLDRVADEHAAEVRVDRTPPLLQRQHETTPDGSTPALAAPPTIADVVDRRTTLPAESWTSVCTWSETRLPASRSVDHLQRRLGSAGNWTSLDLTQDPDDSTLWTERSPSGRSPPATCASWCRPSTASGSSPSTTTTALLPPCPGGGARDTPADPPVAGEPADFRLVRIERDSRTRCSRARAEARSPGGS